MAFKLNRSSKEPMSEINVTPFVDVMLVLLIIFMVTAPLLTVGVQVDLPESSADSLPEEAEPLTLSIIGCVVNGPGEALKSEIGLTGGGKETNLVYLSGVADHKIKNSEIVDHIVQLVEERISKNDKN